MSDVQQRLAATVDRLAALDRRTAGEGERRAAQWIADELRAAGVDARLHPFRTQSSWAPAQTAHALAGIAAAALGSRALAAATLASYEADVSGRSHWARTLLPAGTGTTVEARIAPSRDKRRTLVIAAHHDAAHTGWVWHPRFVAASRRRSAETGQAVPSHLLPALALLALAAGPRAARRPAAALLTTALALFAQSRASSTAPGANDNATGVAVALELGRQLARQRLAHTEAILLFPGGEEVGTTGSLAWLRGPGRALDPATTLMIGLDSLGSGGAVVLPRREGITGTYRDEDLDLADEAAAGARLPKPPRVAFPNVTDAMIGRQHGLHAFTVMTYRDGWIKNLHRPTDTPDQVEWSTVHDCLALTAAAARLWDDRAASA